MWKQPRGSPDHIYERSRSPGLGHRPYGRCPFCCIAGGKPMDTPSARLLNGYLQRLDGAAIDPAAAAFFASLDQLQAAAPVVAQAIVQELRDQRANLKLIASENYCSLATQLAHGNLFTDKYAEGYAGHRFYAGCDNLDTIEAEAARLARELFGAEHAYVQPHSGADANLVAFLTVLSSKVQAPLLAKLEQPDPSKVSREHWARVR